MKKLVLFSTAVLALGAASFSMADNYQVVESPSVKHGGFYIGGGAGATLQSLPSKLFTNEALQSLLGADASQSSSTDYITANAHLGYLFPLTDSFLLGAEVGYNYLPSVTYKVSGQITPDEGDAVPVNDAKLKISSYSIDFLGVAKYYITNSFNVFAKAGGTYVNESISLPQLDDQLDGGSINASKGKIEPKVAGGLGYNITPNMELTVEYSHSFGNDIKSIGTETDQNANTNDKLKLKFPSNNTVLVGLNYYFN